MNRAERRALARGKTEVTVTRGGRWSSKKNAKRGGGRRDVSASTYIIKRNQKED